MLIDSRIFTLAENPKGSVQFAPGRFSLRKYLFKGHAYAQKGIVALNLLLTYRVGLSVVQVRHAFLSCRTEIGNSFVRANHGLGKILSFVSLVYLCLI